MWGSLVLGIIINIFFPIGYVLHAVAIGCMIFIKVTASKNYNKYLRAKGIIQPKTADKPVKKKSKEKGNFCSACGSNNPPGSKYCNECGNVM
jgi:hypothetical protein